MRMPRQLVLGLADYTANQVYTLTMDRAKEKFVITIHLLLVVVAYTSWLWVDYRILLVVAVLHILMLEIFRGCPLSHMQFPEDKSKRFYEWWLARLGIDVTRTPKRRHRVRIFMQYGLPAVIVLLGLILQESLGVSPLIKMYW